MSDTLQKRIPVLDLTPEIEELWDELNAAFQRVMKSGRFIMGPEVEAFENEVAEYLGVKHAIGVNSGTDALVIGLRALDIGPGDEVITTPFSFFATAESISNVGAIPVFVDVDERTFNIDPTLIEPAITEKTKAIMPVHLYGRPAEMNEIMAIAEKHGLKVIEDCAQSFGARYQGKIHTGTIGDVGAFSFFPSKNLGAFGDGGLIATNDDRAAELGRMLRAHGAKRKYHNEMLGYNSRLDSLQAALLRVKLPHVDRWNEARVVVAETYNRLLATFASTVTPKVVSGHVFHQYTIRCIGRPRQELTDVLKASGIDTMVYYPTPQNRLPIYGNSCSFTPKSDQLSAEVLSLPIWPGMGASSVQAIADTIRRLQN